MAKRDELKTMDKLKFQLTSSELKEHLKKRADYHAKQATLLEKQFKELKELAEEEAPVGGKNFCNNNASAASSVIDHRKKVTSFTWMSEHVVPNTLYLLSMEDLVSIEATKGYY
jgi:hypothetical protein